MLTPGEIKEVARTFYGSGWLSPERVECIARIKADAHAAGLADAAARLFAGLELHAHLTAPDAFPSTPGRPDGECICTPWSPPPHNADCGHSPAYDREAIRVFSAERIKPDVAPPGMDPAPDAGQRDGERP